jgi:competence transcription factor ComK
MSDLTIKGAIKLINEVKVISDRFSVREFVITTFDSKYPQDILFQAVNDKMDMVAPLKVSHVVDVSFNLRGREFNGRYYNTLDVWKVTHDKEFVDPAAPSVQPQSEQDDLPF